MMYKLYDITDIEARVGFGDALRIRSNLRVMIKIAYRMTREVYKRGVEMDLLIIGDSFSMILSSIPGVGILISRNRSSVWAKEVL